MCDDNERTEVDKMTVGYVAQLTAAAPMPQPGFQGCTFSNTVQINGDVLAQLRKDADRWRWLRQQGGWPDTEAAMMNATPENFDEMADAHIGAA